MTRHKSSALPEPPAQTADLYADGALNVDAAAAFVGVKRTKLYSLMTSGELPYSQMGTRRVIPRRALVELLKKCQVGAA